MHLSYAPAVAASAALHFSQGADLVAWRIDPRRIDVPLVEAATPRGPMPHAHGSVAADAIVETIGPSRWNALEDRVTGHRVAFVAFEGMTLLDLVGVYDPVSRLRTMGFDPAMVTDLVGASHERVWSGDGASLTASTVRPELDAYDLVVIPGGYAARELARDAQVLEWLRRRPANRLWASVCTGSLVLAAAGMLHGRRATTHRSALELLGVHQGVTVVRERVVRDGSVITAGGVSSGLDLGLHLVALLADDHTAEQVAAQMEYPWQPRSQSGDETATTVSP